MNTAELVKNVKDLVGEIRKQDRDGFELSELQAVLLIMEFLEYEKR